MYTWLMHIDVFFFCLSFQARKNLKIVLERSASLENQHDVASLLYYCFSPVLHSTVDESEENDRIYRVNIFIVIRLNLRLRPVTWMSHFYWTVNDQVLVKDEVRLSGKVKLESISFLVCISQPLFCFVFISRRIGR